MKRHIVALFALAAFFATGCSAVVTKHFKVVAEPQDSVIRVVSGVELKALKFRSPATITADVPKDPALAAKAIVEVSRDNYMPKSILLGTINDGDSLKVKLEKIPSDIVRYRLSYRLVTPVASQELRYRDKIIAISFAVNEQSFQMRFENVSSYDLKILGTVPSIRM